jgi:2-haloacid dehalogenase
MNSLQALVFDAYGTLFDVHSVIAKGEEFFPGRGQALSQLWRTKQLEYTWLRSLMGRYEDFSVVTRQGLAYACAALTLPCSDAQSAALMDAYRTLKPYPEVRAALTQLAGRRLAILSNGAPEMLSAVVQAGDLQGYFHVVLSVHDVGIYKPDPRVYQLAVDRLGIARERIGFVSSNGWDAAGAAAFGFTVYWINRLGAPVEHLPAKPEAVIRDLSELPSLLAA